VILQRQVLPNAPDLRSSPFLEKLTVSLLRCGTGDGIGDRNKIVRNSVRGHTAILKEAAIGGDNVTSLEKAIVHITVSDARRSFSAGVGGFLLIRPCPSCDTARPGSRNRKTQRYFIRFMRETTQTTSAVEHRVRNLAR
jgi:hypothetical protein